MIIFIIIIIIIIVIIIIIIIIIIIKIMNTRLITDGTGVTDWISHFRVLIKL